jgi:hypothetical protein
VVGTDHLTAAVPRGTPHFAPLPGGHAVAFGDFWREPGGPGGGHIGRARFLRSVSKQTTFGDLNHRASPRHGWDVSRRRSSSGMDHSRSQDSSSCLGWLVMLWESGLVSCYI